MNPTIKSLRAVTGLSSVLGLAVLSTGAFAQFTAGSIVVARVGAGTAALNNGGTPISLVQYSPTGTLGPVLNLPTAASGANRRLVVSGTASSEGRLKLSANGRLLVLVGYDAAVGQQGPASATASLVTSVNDGTPASVNRVVGLINWATGAIDTTTALTNAYSANNIRGAATVDGTGIYTAGTGGNAGVRFVNRAVSLNDSVRVDSAPSSNIRTVDFYGGQLFASTGTTNDPGAGVYSVGRGLPTASTAVTPAPSFALTPTYATDLASPPPPPPATAQIASPYDFVFAGSNTLYIADDRSVINKGGIQKFTRNADNTFSYRYTIVAPTPNTSGYSSVTGSVNPNGTITLYATTTGVSNSLVSVTDNIADITTPTSTFTTLATAGTNQAFRGVVVLNPVISGKVLYPRPAVIDPTQNPLPSPTTIEVKGSTGSLAVSNIIGDNQNYYLGGFVPGAYNLRAKDDRHLAQIKPASTTGGSVIVDFNLLAGDFAPIEVGGDNAIDFGDLSTMLQAYNALFGDALYDTYIQADINYDGGIDFGDLSTLLQNYNAFGDDF